MFGLRSARMFTPHDQNHLPAAPSVKIPTLSSSGGGAAVGSTYTPSLSLRRRFGPALQPAEVHEVTAKKQHGPMAELCVHECGVPSGTVESPPSSQEDDAMEPLDMKSSNERDQVEDVTVLAASSRSGSADGAPQTEFLLQKDEFLERLVRRVRASCADVMQDKGGAAEEPPERRREERVEFRRSPPPRRSSPTSVTAAAAASTQWRDYDDADGAGQEWEQRIGNDVVQRGRAPSRSRSQSPSPLSSPALPHQDLDAAGKSRHSQDDVAAPVSPPTSPAALRSRATSPDPRAPSTDLFAAGGAMRSSLQHSRCSGVSRSRRSLSAERAEVADAVGDDGLEMQQGEDAFWQRASSLSSERAGVNTAQHPQWVPHPVPQARPAWNQRQPPKKQRPIVSAPGSIPPRSSRHSLSRSPERASTRKVSLSAAGSAHSAEHAFRRSASLSGTPPARQTPPQRSFSVTAPRPTVAAVSTHKPTLEEGLVVTAQSPIDAATTTSPLSPPSARALFQSIEVDSGTRTTPQSTASTTTQRQHQQQQQQQHEQQPRQLRQCANSSLSLNVQSLQQTCDAAVERATRAERQCGVLTLAMEQLLVEHVAEKAEWQARLAALEQQLSKVTQWISSVDAEANLSVAEAQASSSSPATPQAAEEAPAPDSSASTTHVAEPTKPLLLARAMDGKAAVWEGQEEEMEAETSSHHGGGDAGRSADVSPLPGAPGATPTPARCDHAGSDSRGTSACPVRVPPSPPIVLRLHALH